MQMKHTFFSLLFALFFVCSLSAQVTIEGANIVRGIAGENITAPAFVYINTADGKAYKANATTTDNQAVGVVLVTAVTDGVTQLAFSGVITWSESIVVGSNYYLSAATSGAITTVAPANIQLVGRALTATRLELFPTSFSSSGGSGDITNGGNTTGATVTIGTNDANALNLETNNVARLEITGGATTGGAATLTNVTANTNTVQDVLTVRANSTGTAAANFGAGLIFQGESSTTDNQDMVRLAPIWTTATHASRTSALVFSNVTSGGALQERFRFTPTQMLCAVSYTIGGGAQALTIGGSSGGVGMSSSGAGASTIQINPESNTASSTGGITILAAFNLTQTSGTRNIFDFPYNFAPTSGTAIHNQLSFTGTLNQTGGASGIVRGINLAHTMTAVSDYRAIDIADNHANAHGIYQTGALTKNVFVGKTSFGATTTPTAQAMFAAGTASPYTAPIKLTAGTNLTTPENGAVEYDGTNYFVTSGDTRYALAKVLTGSATLDFPSTSAYSSNDLTISVAGAAAGDVVSLGVDISATGISNGAFVAYVSALNTVTVRFSNNSAGSINPASAAFKATVFK